MPEGGADVTSIPDAQRRAAAQASDGRPGALRAIEQRVLWLSAAIVDHANRVRPNPSGLKVGGHQASSASMVSIMTALWFGQLQPGRPGVGQAARVPGTARDQVPARRAGRVLPDAAALVRRPAELPEPVQGSRPGGLLDRVGGYRGDRPDLGGAGPHGTSARSSAGPGPGGSTRWSATPSWTRARCWEAVIDPMVTELGEIVWIVDLNRQSLDRVVPVIGTPRLQGMFAAAGWQVLTVKYGRLLTDLLARPGGGALRARIDTMTNPEYQRLLRCPPGQLRDRLPGDGPDGDAIRAAARRRQRRAAARRHPQPGRPRPRRARARVRRDRRQPADGDLRLHGQGVRPGHRGPPAEPLRAAVGGRARRAGRAGPASIPGSPGRSSPNGSAEARAVRGHRRAAAPRAAVPPVPPRPACRPGPYPGRAWPAPRPRSAGRCST